MEWTVNVLTKDRLTFRHINTLLETLKEHKSLLILKCLQLTLAIQEPHHTKKQQLVLAASYLPAILKKKNKKKKPVMSQLGICKINLSILQAGKHFLYTVYSKAA